MRRVGIKGDVFEVFLAESCRVLCGVMAWKQGCNVITWYQLRGVIRNGNIDH